MVVMVRIAGTERKFGFQAFNSSITNISFNAFETTCYRFYFQRPGLIRSHIFFNPGHFS